MWDIIEQFWPVFVGLLNLVLAVTATVHIVLRKRDSRAAIGWAGLVWLAPILGVLAYVCFGINRIQRKAVSLGVRAAWNPTHDTHLTTQDLQRRDDFVVNHPNLVGLAAVGRHLSGRPLLPGNSVQPLIDGDEAYPSMLGAIDGAQRSVALLSYIFDSDRAGDAFFESLVAAHQRGVEVRVLIDDVGSRYSKVNMVHRLRKAGVQAAAFLPTRVPRLPKYANLRNHRKILVVDGRIGFTGGTNIREGHCLALEPKSPVQCVHFRLVGPVVAQLQEMFALDWAFASGESLSGELWFPEIDRSGTVFARGVPDGPDEDFEKMCDTMLAALAAATRQVRIVSPYFLPEAPLIHALNVTAMRGVDVRIYVPQRVNVALVRWASMAQLGQLLEKGCRVYFTPPPFDHTKLLVVDGAWSLIGSTNWDPRSLRLNFEFNVECYDEHLAGKLNRIIAHKAEHAQQATQAQLDARSFPIRLRDGLARLATPYL